MRLDENYTLEGETYNWILKYEKPTGNISENTGKEIISRDKWYFPKIKQALEVYVDHSLKECKSIEDILSKLEDIHQTIETLTINPKERKRK